MPPATQYARSGDLHIAFQVFGDSETIKGIVAGSGIAFKDRGQYDLKGLPDSWRLYEVVT